MEPKSISELLDLFGGAQHPTERRAWGFFQNLLDIPGVKVKILGVEPRSTLSYQKHEQRAEVWFVLAGRPTLHIEGGQSPLDNIYLVPCGAWHQIGNPTDETVYILEVQLGICKEEDIVRAQRS
jgi:mannose-6-phosphate isomerase-like protein (cupin superfamily)